MSIASNSLVDVACVAVRMGDVDGCLGYYSAQTQASNHVQVLNKEDNGRGDQS